MARGDYREGGLTRPGFGAVVSSIPSREPIHHLATPFFRAIARPNLYAGSDRKGCHSYRHWRALWDTHAKSRKKLLWELVVDMTPVHPILCNKNYQIDFGSKKN